MGSKKNPSPSWLSCKRNCLRLRGLEQGRCPKTRHPRRRRRMCQRHQKQNKRSRSDFSGAMITLIVPTWTYGECVYLWLAMWNETNLNHLRPCLGGQFDAWDSPPTVGLQWSRPFTEMAYGFIFKKTIFFKLVFTVLPTFSLLFSGEVMVWIIHNTVSYANGFELRLVTLKLHSGWM